MLKNKPANTSRNNEQTGTGPETITRKKQNRKRVKVEEKWVKEKPFVSGAESILYGKSAAR